MLVLPIGEGKQFAAKVVVSKWDQDPSRTLVHGRFDHSLHVSDAAVPDDFITGLKMNVAHQAYFHVQGHDIESGSKPLPPIENPHFSLVQGRDDYKGVLSVSVFLPV